MNKEELLARLGEIAESLKVLQEQLVDEEQEDVNIEEVEEEANKLIEEKRSLEETLKQLEDEKTSRAKLLNEIAEGRKGTVVKDYTKEERQEGEDMSDKLYRSAFLKNLQGKALNAEERAAFTHTTENTGVVIPTETAEKIYSTLGEVHPIVGDVKRINANGMFRVIQHTEIAQGDAAVVGETKANDDEENTFVEVILAGKKISKHIKVSYELKNMALDSFEAYLVDELGQRIEAALAKEIVDTLKGTDAKAIHADNKITTEAGLTIKDVLGGLGALKNVGTTYVYANRADIYGDIALMGNENQTVNFITDLSSGVKGNLLGNGIKQEDALAKGEILILDPNQFLLNVAGPLEILRDREATTGDYVIAAHMMAEGALTNQKAGALITVTPAVGA